MVGGRGAAVIVHVELFKPVKMSFNLYFPRGENGSWIQNGEFCLFCQSDVQNYLCQGAVASQGSAGAARDMVGTSLSCWLQAGKSLNSNCSKGCLLSEQPCPCWGAEIAWLRWE